MLAAIHSYLIHVWPLLIASFLAGAVDSIGGGGGLISVPAFMGAGLPRAMLLGTNKNMSVIGTAVAVYRYARAGLLPALSGRWWTVLILIAIVSASLGALVSQLGWYLDHFRVLVPVLLTLVMSSLINRWFWDEPRAARKGLSPESIPLHSFRSRFVIALIAAYDGVFGPGAGTFFLSYFERSGFSTIQANAITKVFNLSSNFGALLFFGSASKVIWPLGCLCGLANVVGQYSGSGLVLKNGKALVRVTVLLVTSAMLIKYFVVR